MSEELMAVMIDTNPSQAPGFYMSLGFAISSWQLVEKGLFGIFLKTSTCSDETIAAAIFYSIEDFSKRVEMTRNAIRLFLPEKSPLYSDWKKLRTRLIDSMERRNALAHFRDITTATVGQTFQMQIQYISSMGNLMAGPPVEQLKDRVAVKMLLPNPADPNEKFKEGNRKDTKKPMTVKEILATQQHFQTFGKELTKFAEKIEPPATPPKG